MKVIIAGNSAITDEAAVYKAIEASKFIITEVVCGSVPGPDQIGEQWAKLHSIPIKYFKANVGEYGKTATVIRDKQMANYADALISVQSDKSHSTNYVVQCAKRIGLKVYTYKVKHGTSNNRPLV